MVLLLATAVSAGGFSLWAQLDDTAPFPKEFRKWAHVKSVLVVPKRRLCYRRGNPPHLRERESP
jgi:hypothetical protein